MDSVIRDPRKYWAFNNGVTILTRQFEKTNGSVTVNGVSVINGAQISLPGELETPTFGTHGERRS